MCPESAGSWRRSSTTGSRQASRWVWTRRSVTGSRYPPTQAITESDLESDNPYNTRKLAGLPPTPISNPGLASMKAAARPAAVDFLYFARKKDCKSHYFARTQAEHDRFLAGPNSFLNGPNACA